MGIGKDIKLNSFDSLFGNENEKGVTEVAIEILTGFEGHPFKVVNDEKMKDLIESIEEYGVLTPILVRQKNNKYEIVSGHRRKFACEQLGMNKIPAIIKDIDDDEAAIMMVDSNIQREEILPSEKAFAYKIKADALKRQAGRPQKNGGQVDPNLKGKKSIDLIAEESGESQKQIKRYIRLTFLIKELLELVDDKKLPFNTAVELSFLTEQEQKVLNDLIESFQKVPSLVQATHFKELSREGKLDEKELERLFESQTEKTKINITKKKIKKYFPEGYTSQQMEEIVYQLLEDWSAKQK